MTFREKLEKEHPEEVDKRYPGGCFGCPKNYGYEDRIPAYICGWSDVSLETKCAKCWNREVKNG